MRDSKKSRMGNYICKIGKYDVRQIVKMGSVTRTFNGGVKKTKGSCESRIYIGKKLIEANLKGVKEAIDKAFELTCKDGDQQLVSKKVLSKYNLVCE